MAKKKVVKKKKGVRKAAKKAATKAVKKKAAKKAAKKVTKKVTNKVAKSATRAQPSLTLDKIYTPDNLREAGWEKNLKTLMSSIQANGLKQPVGVWPFPKGQEGPNGETYELVFGSRRLEACRRLDWKAIPIILESPKASRKDRFYARLAENAGREGITSYEEALEFQRGMQEYNITVSEIAERTGRSNSYVSQRLLLLKMSDEVQEAVRGGDITPTHVREISKISDEKEQAKLLKFAKGRPVTELREKISQLDEGKKSKSKRGRPEKKSIAKVRTVSEIKIELGKLDVLLKEATEKNDQKRVQYYQGMMRGLGWSAGLSKTLR